MCGHGNNIRRKNNNKSGSLAKRGVHLCRQLCDVTFAKACVAATTGKIRLMSLLSSEQ